MSANTRRAVLCGMILPENEADFEEIYAECKELCHACFIHVEAEMTQKMDHVDPRSGFRSGKINELRNLVNQLDADVIVFANNLSITVAKRIQEATGVTVIDRTSLILEIFSLRAKTKQAMIQVEMARLQYDLPRLTLDVEKESHSRGGGFKNRGAGEMRSSLVQRKYKARIKYLKKELEDIQKNAEIAEVRRNKSSLAKAALVGYTNAGKSSTMNAMLALNNRDEATVFEKDMLFATLDTSVRHMTYGQKEFLLYDTVGFVSDLPKPLIEAFKSTLDAARNADLLIHVVDASNPNWQEKALITEETLKEIGAGDIPIIRVFNKIDLIEEDEDMPMGICISCKENLGVEDLVQTCVEHLYPVEKSMQCLVPYSEMGLLQKNRKVLNIKVLDNLDDGQHVILSGEKERLKAFEMYKID